METAILSQPKRLPFMPSSNLALDVMSGKLYDIDFEDFLNGTFLRFFERGLAIDLICLFPC